MCTQKQLLSKTSSPRSLTHKCITTIENLTSPKIISCLAVHNHLLYAASVNEINVYDLSSSSSLQPSSFYTHVDTFNTDPTSGSTKSIAFNNNNDKIFTAHQDCKIRVWQLNDKSKQHQLISTLPTVKDRFLRFMLPKNYVQIRRHKKGLWIEHSDAVSGLVVNNIEGLMYSISWDRSLKVWDVDSYRCLESLNKAHEDAINAMVVSQNGTVYTASADGSIRVWERHNGNMRRHSLVTTLHEHKSTVNAIVLNGDGSVLFSGSCDCSIMVWEWEGDRHDHPVVFKEVLWGHTGAVLCLINVGDLIVSGSSDRTVRIWKRGKEGRYCCAAVLEGHEKPVKSLVAMSTDFYINGGVLICSGSLDGEIKVWEINNQF